MVIFHGYVSHNQMVGWYFLCAIVFAEIWWKWPKPFCNPSRTTSALGTDSNVARFRLKFRLSSSLGPVKSGVGTEHLSHGVASCPRCAWPSGAAVSQKVWYSMCAFCRSVTGLLKNHHNYLQRLFWHLTCEKIVKGSAEMLQRFKTEWYEGAYTQKKSAYRSCRRIYFIYIYIQ